MIEHGRAKLASTSKKLLVIIDTEKKKGMKEDKGHVRFIYCESCRIKNKETFATPTFFLLSI